MADLGAVQVLTTAGLPHRVAQEQADKVMQEGLEHPMVPGTVVVAAVLEALEQVTLDWQLVAVLGWHLQLLALLSLTHLAVLAELAEEVRLMLLPTQGMEGLHLYAH